MTANEEAVSLRITLGHAGDDSLNLRFDPTLRQEILPLLDEHKISHDTAIELSAGPAEWIEVVRVLGSSAVIGFTSLAIVISKLSHRNDGKKFALSVDGLKFESQGLTPKEVEQLLADLPAKQAHLDEETRRSMGIPPEASAD